MRLPLSTCAFACTFAVVVGCGRASTEVRVEVTGPTGNAAPVSVTVNVFDRVGLIGHADIAPAALPGAITVRGLADSAADLRVVGIGVSRAGVQSLGGTHVMVQPFMRTVATIVLSANVIDSDGDQVPDPLDDCPSAADPMQDSPCLNVASDFGVIDAEPDLSSVPPGSDLAVPPDLAPPATGCAAAGVAFCDGFETGVISPQWNAVNQANGTVTADNTRAYRGSWSLHIHNNALPAKGTADVELNEGKTFPSTHFFVRAYVFVPAAFGATAGDFILAEQGVDPYAGITLGLVNSSFQTDSTVGATKTSTTMMPRDQWVCVEWEVQLGANGYTALQVDGQAATNLGGTQNLTFDPAVSELGLALVTTAPPSGGVPARDLWFDEVMVNPTAIGCTR